MKSTTITSALHHQEEPWGFSDQPVANSNLTFYVIVVLDFISFFGFMACLFVLIRLACSRAYKESMIKTMPGVIMISMIHQMCLAGVEIGIDSQQYPNDRNSSCHDEECPTFYALFGLWNGLFYGSALTQFIFVEVAANNALQQRRIHFNASYITILSIFLMLVGGGAAGFVLYQFGAHGAKRRALVDFITDSLWLVIAAVVWVRIVFFFWDCKHDKLSEKLAKALKVDVKSLHNQQAKIKKKQEISLLQYQVREKSEALQPFNWYLAAFTLASVAVVTWMVLDCLVYLEYNNPSEYPAFYWTQIVGALLFRTQRLVQAYYYKIYRQREIEERGKKRATAEDISGDTFVFDDSTRGTTIGRKESILFSASVSGSGPGKKGKKKIKFQESSFADLQEPLINEGEEDPKEEQREGGLHRDSASSHVATPRKPKPLVSVPEGRGVCTCKLDHSLPLTKQKRELHTKELWKAYKCGIMNYHYETLKMWVEELPEKSLYDSNSLLKQNIGCDPKTGDTPLHFAASLGRVEIAELFLGRCDVQAKNNKGFTPVHTAIAAKLLMDSQCAKMVDMLIENNEGSMLIRDNLGRTPRVLAVDCNKAGLQRYHSLAVFSKHELSYFERWQNYYNAWTPQMITSVKQLFIGKTPDSWEACVEWMAIGVGLEDAESETTPDLDIISTEHMKRVIRQMLAHCHTFAKELASNNDPRERNLFEVLYKSAANKKAEIPRLLHAEAMRKKIVGRIEPYEANVSQEKHLEFLTKKYKAQLDDIAGRHGVRLDQLKTTMMIIVSQFLDNKLNYDIDTQIAPSEALFNPGIKSIKRAFDKVDKDYNGNCAKLVDTIRRSFCSNNVQAHDNFLRALIGKANLHLRMVRVKCTIDDDTVDVKHTIINALYSTNFIYKDLLDQLDGVLATLRIVNNMEQHALWGAAAEAFSLKKLQNYKINIIIEFQLYYPVFLKRKKHNRILYEIVRVTNSTHPLEELSRNCQTYACNKRMAGIE
eukprot:m.89872 g.89872  ORF g.89872 m.89872 type:complete len:993 (-) comp13245_c0_seq1:37-3015(-)